MGTICKYITKFLGLMFDIKDMFQENKLFYFFEGFKSRTGPELQRQHVQDMATL